MSDTTAVVLTSVELLDGFFPTPDLTAADYSAGFYGSEPAAKGTDRFGHRLSHKGQPNRCVGINAVLPVGKDNAMSIEEIAKKSGETASYVKYHLMYYIARPKLHLGRYLREVDEKFYVEI